MRDIEITPECLEFVDDQYERVREKFFQLIEGRDYQKPKERTEIKPGATGAKNG